MKNIVQKISSLNWELITKCMHEKGYSVVQGLLPGEACERLIKSYDDPGLYRKIIVMERYRFGMGEYKYFRYPLPEMIQTIREAVYSNLAPIANQWMNWLNIDRTYPASFQEFQQQCHHHKQDQPTVLILKYGQGGYNTLHQDLYGEVYFPIQIVLMLNEPDQDFEGGLFVLTEQIPRAQSKAIVLNPRKGDMLIFTTHFRPVKGSKGFYRVNMKHGVSEVHRGQRHTLGIIFHDALT